MPRFSPRGIFEFASPESQADSRGPRAAPDVPQSPRDEAVLADRKPIEGSPVAVSRADASSGQGVNSQQCENAENHAQWSSVEAACSGCGFWTSFGYQTMIA